MQESRIRVLIFEVDCLLRDMLRTVLGSEARLTLVGATGDAMQVLLPVERAAVDVVLVGLNRDTEQEALLLAHAISALPSATKVVFLGDVPDRRALTALPAFREAGWSYLLRQSVSDVSTLVRAIEGVASGFVIMDPLVAERVGQRDSRLDGLTKRQLEVLSLIAKGHNNAAISRLLVIEEKSVENHINAIFSHLNLRRGDDSGHARVRAALLYLSEEKAENLVVPDLADHRQAA